MWTHDFLRDSSCPLVHMIPRYSPVSTLSDLAAGRVREPGRICLRASTLQQYPRPATFSSRIRTERGGPEETWPVAGISPKRDRAQGRNRWRRRSSTRRRWGRMALSSGCSLRSTRRGLCSARRRGRRRCHPGAASDQPGAGNSLTPQRCQRGGMWPEQDGQLSHGARHRAGGERAMEAVQAPH
jgi:hypothetical protein